MIFTKVIESLLDKTNVDMITSFATVIAYISLLLKSTFIALMDYSPTVLGRKGY